MKLDDTHGDTLAQQAGDWPARRQMPPPMPYKPLAEDRTAHLPDFSETMAWMRKPEAWEGGAPLNSDDIAALRRVQERVGEATMPGANPEQSQALSDAYDAGHADGLAQAGSHSNVQFWCGFFAGCVTGAVVALAIKGALPWIA